MPNKKQDGARIAIRLTRGELEKLDKKVAHMQHKLPGTTRSTAVRAAIAAFSE